MLGRLLGAWRRPAGLEGTFLSGLPRPEDVPADTPVALVEDIEAARRELGAGGVGPARRRLEQAARAHPRNALPLLVLARLEAHIAAADADAVAHRARSCDAGADGAHSLAQHFYESGTAAVNAEDHVAALRRLELAAFLVPEAWRPLEMLGCAHYLSGDLVAGRAAFDAALERAEPADRWRLRLSRLVHTLPQILPSVAAIDAGRAWFAAELDALESDVPDGVDPAQAMRVTCFYLCYQGRDNRALLERVANLLRRACPALRFAPPLARLVPGGKTRVAVVSLYLNSHSIGHWYRGFVRALIESGRYEVTLFTGDVVPDQRLGEEAARRHRSLPGTLEAAQQVLAAAAPEVLIYTDVGMHPLCYLLSFARFAPLQLLLVGHPETSGVPVIDWFISNVYQDVADAPAHYSERLVRLPHIPVLVELTPRPEAPMTREQLGLAPDVRYYVCPMMLQKMHPDFDAALAAILRGDPGGEVVLFADRRGSRWQGQLEKRFEQVMPDVAARIVFRPYAPRLEFHSLLMAADCLLDPFHFSGGVTTYIALSLCAPMVTLPGPLFRSRMSAGIYAQAGITGLTARDADDYVRIALELGRDPALRADLGRRIAAAHSRIFGFREAVVEFMDWLDGEIAATAART